MCLSDLHDLVNELGLRNRVRLPIRELPCIIESSKLPLQYAVFVRDVAVITQVVAKCQRTPLFSSTRFNYVNMMRVGPLAWSMEERAHRIIGMGRVSVAEPSEWLRISADRIKLFNRNLNVNDWLRCQTRNGRRTIVIDSTGQLS